MVRVISSRQMKQLDYRTINDYGIPALDLMENAGKGCADYLHQHFSKALKIGTIVLCGKGNNGGDGYVIARWLVQYGYKVGIIEFGSGAFSMETEANRKLCLKQNLPVTQVESESDLGKFGEIMQSGITVIDAIFGIGFRGELEGYLAEAIELVNRLKGFRVAVDIPSGLCADSGKAKLAFRADVTLTMAAMKYGHVLNQGKHFCGRIEVIPIGIPEHLWDTEKTGLLLNESSVKLPVRWQSAHKGDFGKLAVIAGSAGYTGAAYMCCQAALRSGAGLITLFCHPSLSSIFAAKLVEVMWCELPLLKSGNLDVNALEIKLKDFDVILFGSGCGKSELTYQLLEFLLKHWQKPAVIDADGLNVLAEHQELYPQLKKKPVVLTPHWGEFCRLAGIHISALYEDCFSELTKFVDKYGLKVLLKSHTSVYYDGDKLLFNNTGNDGLAKGGSGDVLAGLIAGFLTQRMPPEKAVGTAVYFLGLTAEYLAGKRVAFSITPMDIINVIFSFPDEEKKEELVRAKP